jgi:circadian clock protein KaiB
MTKHKLKLFVMGQTSRSQYAIRTLQRICENAMPDAYELTIIDVLEQPALAEENKIIATPTLIKEWPLPVRRVLGDLSDQEKLLSALGIYLQD